uniref:hypothetical protein n=1 Tax=Cupriavidus taiwanensis TaxID=164546 RepID=UPI001558872B|nr:hypothetical protein [Cupriavidus taiwanensis]
MEGMAKTARRPGAAGYCKSRQIQPERSPIAHDQDVDDAPGFRQRGVIASALQRHQSAAETPMQHNSSTTGIGARLIKVGFN